MSEPTTARAMAFRVEDMEVEERVEALEQWGDALREAGIQEALERVAAASVATEPGVEPFKPVWVDPPLTPKRSLVERIVSTFPDLNIPHSTQEQAAIGMLAEALDALTARVQACAESIDHIDDRCAALGTKVANLDTKTAHLPFPAAPVSDPNAADHG